MGLTVKIGAILNFFLTGRTKREDKMHLSKAPPTV
jgi:hypothetical protein